MTHLQTYLQHQIKWIWLFWIAFFLIHWAANSTTVIMDLGNQVMMWEPIVWEGSSGLGFACMLPVLVWFDRQFPLNFRSLPKHGVYHAGFSILFSLGHVGIMVAVRELVYAMQGGNYNFGHWPTELLYEYLKDFRSYLTFLTIIYLYRFFIFRLQGEVAVLSQSEPQVIASTGQGAPVSRNIGQAVATPTYLERLLVKKLGSEFLVKVNEIEWLEACGNYVNLHVKGRVYPHRGTMKALAEQLDPAVFVRVHRSAIVNVNRIERIEPQDSGDAIVFLDTTQSVSMSRRYRGAVDNFACGN